MCAGGENMSVTSGVVSRLDMQQYVHGSCELLAVQAPFATWRPQTCGSLHVTFEEKRAQEEPLRQDTG